MNALWREEALARARISAAAQDLLEACKCIAYEADRGSGNDILVDKLRFRKVLDAIQKAESK